VNILTVQFVITSLAMIDM